METMKTTESQRATGLHAQWTTPEQSGRLLAAGMPEQTADCYYRRKGGTNLGWTGPVALFGGVTMTRVRKWEEEEARAKNTTPQNLRSKNPVRHLPDDLLPCWTTGRLMEIHLRCFRPGYDTRHADIHTWGETPYVWMENVRFGDDTQRATDNLVTDMCNNMRSLRF